MTSRTLLLALASTSFVPAAHADEVPQGVSLKAPPPPVDDFVAVEVPMALGDHGGALPAIAVFRDNGFGAVGVRVRGGLLKPGTDMPSSADDEAVGILGFALRRRLGSGWVELGGGAAVSQHGVAASVEVATGWSFRLGPTDVGPSFRYMRIDETSMYGGALSTVLIGAELGLARDKPRSLREEAEVASESTADHAEPTAIACAKDIAPCERKLSAAIDSGLVTIGQDRIVIDVHALLAPSSDRMHANGVAIAAALAHRINQHSSWGRIRIEGYAEIAASDFDNWRVSQRWTASLRKALLDSQVDPERLDAIGFGRIQRSTPPSPSATTPPPNRIEIVIAPAAYASSSGR